MEIIPHFKGTIMRIRILAALLCILSFGVSAAECGFWGSLFGWCEVVTPSTGPGQGDPSVLTGPGQGDPR